MGQLEHCSPTEVFDSFWYFAAERQHMYLRRVLNAPAPWTDDEILCSYRFTNVYRASDRVSQYLLGQVIYDGSERAPVDDVLRILLFKLFNRVSTWELLTGALGDITAESFKAQEAVEVLDAAMRRGCRVYSAAYIVPPVPGTEGRKHAGHLRLLDEQLASGDLHRLLQKQSMEELVEALRAWPGVGPFLSYQLAIDLNYSPHLAFDEDDFVLAGPGARDGLSKCFAGARHLQPEQLIRRVAAMQDEAFADRGLTFEGLWGRPMKLIDVQNVFCEISKYARAAHPEVQGSAGRSRIKQRFVSAGPLPVPAFPPRWEIRVPTAAVGGSAEWNHDRLGEAAHGAVFAPPRGVTVRAARTTADQVRGVNSA
jgi:hypothetical protein